LEDTLFWAQAGSWPRDPPGYLFLARAFNSVGRSLFCNVWSGDEACAPYTDLGRADRTALERKLADHANRERKIASILARRDRLPSERARASKVRNAIATWAEAGQLPTVVRPQEGGLPLPIPSHAWSTENLEPRFRRCMLSLAKPFSDGFAGNSFGWIFVERASLDRLLGSTSIETPFATVASVQPSPTSGSDEVLVSEPVEAPEPCGTACEPATPQPVSGSHGRSGCI
jgi:hypothetical protein